MPFYRAHRDKMLLRYLGIGEALDDVVQHIKFASGERALRDLIDFFESQSLLFFC